MYRQILFHYLRLKIFNIILNKFSYLLKYIDKTDKYQFRLIFQMSRNTFPVKRCVGRIIFIFEFCLIIHFFWWHIYHFLQVYLDKANKQSFQIVFHMFRNIRPPYRGRAKVVGYSDLWIVPSNRRRFLYVCPLVHLAGVIKRKRKKIDFMWYIICHELPLYTGGDVLWHELYLQTLIYEFCL